MTAFLASNNCSSSLMFRRRRFDECGGYDETMKSGFEDWEFTIRLLEAGGRLAMVEEPLIRYRVVPDSSNVVSMNQRTELYTAIMDRHPELFARHHRQALLAHEARSDRWRNLCSDVVMRHDSEAVEQIVSFGDGGTAAAVRVQTHRAHTSAAPSTS